jgi:hypothetical protein
VTAVLYASTASAVDRYSEEKGGGLGEPGAEPEGSETGYPGGGEFARGMLLLASFLTSSCSSSGMCSTGVPSAPSCVCDNVIAEDSETIRDY